MSEVRVGQQMTEVRILLTAAEAEKWRVQLGKHEDADKWPEGMIELWHALCTVASAND